MNVIIENAKICHTSDSLNSILVLYQDSIIQNRDSSVDNLIEQKEVLVESNKDKDNQMITMSTTLTASGKFIKQLRRKLTVVTGVATVAVGYIIYEILIDKK